MTSLVKDQKTKISQKIKDRFISAFIGLFAIVWLFPIAWTLFSSLRPYKDIRANGILSWPSELNFNNYIEAIEESSRKGTELLQQYQRAEFHDKVERLKREGFSADEINDYL